MGRLGLWVAGFIFIAAAIVVLFNGWNWQQAIILAAIGAGIIFFLSRG